MGNETRLRIFRFLVKNGDRKVAVGDIQKKLDIPGSTLSHHISHLVRVGLVIQERDGRTLYCTPDTEKLESMINFLLEKCCDGNKCIEVLELAS